MIKEFFSKLTGLFIRKNVVRCRRCGRVLKNPQAQERGLGDCCLRKVLDERYTRKLFIPKKGIDK